MTRIAVAIDLGTTCCRVSVCRNEKVETISDDLGNAFIPCWVAFTETEHVIGGAAIEQADGNVSNSVYDIKRISGRDFDDCTELRHTYQWPFHLLQKGGCGPHASQASISGSDDRTESSEEKYSGAGSECYYYFEPQTPFNIIILTRFAISRRVQSRQNGGRGHLQGQAQTYFP
jgi:hypothetical protein